MTLSLKPTDVDGTDARRAEHPHFLSQVVDRQGVLDSHPQCFVTRKSCQVFPLAKSQVFGLARPDAGRRWCPGETLGKGKGREDGCQGCEIAPVEES